MFCFVHDQCTVDCSDASQNYGRILMRSDATTLTTAKNYQNTRRKIKKCQGFTFLGSKIFRVWSYENMTGLLAVLSEMILKLNPVKNVLYT